MSKKIEYKLNDGSYNVVYGVEHWTIQDEMLMIKTKAWTHYILFKNLISYEVER